MNIKYQIVIAAICAVCYSCGSNGSKDEEQDIESVTPVTITYATISDMEQAVELNAVATFLQKSSIRATTNGYLKSVNVQLGQRVYAGQELFTLMAKEAANLGSMISDLDPTFNFSGVVKIVAGKSGFITQMEHQTGDYVTEGDILAEISDLNGLVFIMQLPYELKPHLAQNHSLTLELPDGTTLQGKVSTLMPTVDAVSQTQNIAIKVDAGESVPENLIAKVKFVKQINRNTVSLPREAILADETQENFWIMKVIGDSLAVRVPVIKGMETSERIEILSPKISPDDVVIRTGNYALADSAKVVIQ